MPFFISLLRVLASRFCATFITTKTTTGHSSHKIPLANLTPPRHCRITAFRRAVRGTPFTPIKLNPALRTHNLCRREMPCASVRESTFPRTILITALRFSLVYPTTFPTSIFVGRSAILVLARTLVRATHLATISRQESGRTHNARRWLFLPYFQTVHMSIPAHRIAVFRRLCPRFY